MPSEIRSRAARVGFYAMNPLEKVLKGLRKRSSKGLRFHPDLKLARKIRAMAEYQGRSAEQVASELILYAFEHRVEAEEKLRPWRELTRREREVAALICQGSAGEPISNRQIAEQLCISPETVKVHIRNILHKFNLHSKIELRQVLADWDFRP